MPLDPRTPVIVGAGQLSQPELPAGDPVDLLAEAARSAALDAGAPMMLARAGSVRVVNLLSRGYPDPAALVASRIGAPGAQSVYTTVGGNSPQVLINRTARDIAEGRLDVAVVGGAESWRTRNWYKKRSEKAPWADQPADARPDLVVGEELPMGSPEELALGLGAPVQFYPMFETALALESADPAAHFMASARLWARFAEVAASNPYAAVRSAPDAATIATPGPDNRMIGYPYTKLMCSNSSVDQAAALILCSVEAAEAAGVPPERWVFVHSGADASDELDVVRRDRLTRSPAIRAVVGETLRLAGVALDDVELIDLYSCFASAVQVAAREIGAGLDRALTVTGGLTFAGGPWNNYVTHSVATMVQRLRERPDALGLCTANGGHLTKHAAGLYSCRPPSAAPRFAHPQDEVDRTPRREVAGEWQGRASLEAYTVMHDRAGEPEVAFAYGLTPDGRRSVAVSRRASVAMALMAPAPPGTTIELDGTGGFDVAVS